ncbi:MAG: hypothetical protein ACE5I0_01535, partial [Candidatus Binatia bacterium]
IQEFAHKIGLHICPDALDAPGYPILGLTTRLRVRFSASGMMRVKEAGAICCSFGRGDILETLEKWLLEERCVSE